MERRVDEHGISVMAVLEADEEYRRRLAKKKVKQKTVHEMISEDTPPSDDSIRAPTADSRAFPKETASPASAREAAGRARGPAGTHDQCRKTTSQSTRKVGQA